MAGTVGIGAGAFRLSFNALAALAAANGIESALAWIWPLIVDGLIVVATVAVVAMGGRPGAWYPWLLLAGAAGVSIWANIFHATMTASPGSDRVAPSLVAAVPPVVLLAVTHLTVVLARRTRLTHGQSGAPAPLRASSLDRCGSGGRSESHDAVQETPRPTRVITPASAPRPTAVPTPREPGIGATGWSQPAPVTGGSPAPGTAAAKTKPASVDPSDSGDSRVTGARQPGRPSAGAAAARELILAHLTQRGGAAFGTEVMDAGRESGFTSDTLKNARRRCRPSVVSTDTPRGRMWRIDEPGHDPAASETASSNDNSMTAHVWQSPVLTQGSGGAP